MNSTRFYRKDNSEYYEVLLEKQDFSATEVLLDFIQETLNDGRIVHIIAERQGHPIPPANPSQIEKTEEMLIRDKICLPSSSCQPAERR